MGALSFMGYIQGEGRQQSSLFPPTLEELVPEDHLVRVIEAYVARLDLQALGLSKAEPLKNGRPGYTKAKRRHVSRHVHEAAFERMHQRMQAHPEMMVRRRSIVEHPFGNLKQWILGNGRFLLRQLRGARTEMALAVNAYNLKRAINVLGARRLIELLG